MKLFSIKSQIHKFDTAKDFAETFNIGEGDFVLSNEFIYNPFFGSLNLNAEVVFLEKYGVGEPSDEIIDAVLATIKGKTFKRIFAVGGGSVIDIAKLLVIKGDNTALDLFEKKVPLIKDKELIIVPTTAGTGSEVTNLSIAEIKAKHTKMGLATDELLADHAVLIPELVKGLPYRFFVASSIDALIHAIESYVSPKSNPYTELFSVKAMELILKGYVQIIEKGEEYRKEIIEDFVIGSNYAGIAFGNTGVGAVHALSYPLGGTYHVPHGEANYQMFVEVFRTYNKKNPNGKIKDIKKILADILNVNGEDDVFAALASILDKLLTRKPLKDYGMKVEDIEGFADSVIVGQARLLANNYVPLSRDEIRDVYKNLY
ncbi:4-hydroxybutyrate dehydrogenase [Clostridium sp. CM028]|uniref:4-hydroxybutyrate dehydrogenase n=1 Tax=unclassified Clostridium TaxID=2614128 RepID=UPI001C0E2D90|nr:MULTISPECIES: 4-hydroxybutyrate dehydrogenase [unclassified Clostridium]MBU3092952.1 4-hydroxybutyrate dehydrogenase [Clostridium sp. CF011]MBW9143978.1 4-hydroxybutyrate dehydrogenase [Clostridium sp. CM027]MBW9147706.1 4-hydroxybutyrate dehydrogenase [Clostridium sp. CM028]UVE41362.1 4-hydroxybutyrate dehydrogenase [Clostridium sp. CM027]WAG70373.1 4-hydroxybutyrate dehydrogenase [Clostridium sp. CF011]